MGMKKLLGPIAVVAAVAVLGLPVFPRPAKAAGPITFSFVSFVPLSNKLEFGFLKKNFIDKINKEAKGEFVIKVRGGPESVPPFNLGVAVQRGIVSMTSVPTAFIDSLVPGANETCLSDYTAVQERQNGIYDYLRDMYKKAGFYYLGRADATDPGFFFLFLRKRVTKPEDFKGLKLGGSTAFHGFYQELGASVMTVAIPDYHSAMERGVVDGITSSLQVGLQFGLQEVSKCLIVPGFYRATPALIVNLKAWNRLPKHLQDLLTENMIEFEKIFPAFERKARVSALERVRKAGVEIVKFPPKMEKWYLAAARNGEWKYAEKRFGDIIPKLREKITKK